MPNTSESVVEVVQSPDSAVYDRAKSARDAYEDAVNSDGVSAASWRAIAREMHITADLMKDAGALPDFVTCHRDRAIDADHEADRAERMVAVAQRHRVIDMSSLVSA